MDRTIAAERRRQEYAVRGRTESEGAIRSKLIGNATQHYEAGRSTRGGDHVLGVTLGPGRIHLDVVADTPRDVLDLQRGHHRAASVRSFAPRRDGCECARGRTAAEEAQH